MRQEPAAARIGRIGHPGVGAGESCGIAGEAEVACQRQIKPGAHSRPVQQRNRGLGKIEQLADESVTRLGPAVSSQSSGSLRLRPFADVGTGAKALAGAREDQRAHRGVGGSIGKRGPQSRQQRKIESVALLRAVEGQETQRPIVGLLKHREGSGGRAGGGG